MKKEEKEKIFWAFIATFLSIIGFIIVILFKRKDKYVMYYANYSLVIFCIGVILGTLSYFFKVLPIIGEIIKISTFLFVIILWVWSFINSLSGIKKEIPVINQITKKIKI